MGNEITYLDLAVLKKLDSESTVEKFGMKINTSFFDAANLLGSMKIKGLIDMQSSIGGQSPITIASEGKELLSTAIQRAAEPINSLDQAILSTLVTGVRELGSLQNSINIRSKDLAFHLYKLKAYDYVDDSIQSAKVSFSLTEKGFLLTRSYRSSASAAEMAPKKEEEKAPEPQEKKHGIEDEIKDLFNLSSFRRPAAKKVPVSSISEVQKEKQGAPFVQGIPSSSGETKAVQASALAAEGGGIKVPQKAEPPPWMRKPVAKKLDQSKMLASKTEFYLQRYGVFLLLLAIFFAIVVIAIIFAVALS
ncbi:hypothetical protein COU37_01135 [Candidatus Micrarchaeota archaeon CG10_big_fil_rev_8_21_14_0_10_45_29]|nr:MAG: hypothetical protein COU37_01135 [Candidatus Micrarchaeota archaeon CG10_big_fil_rev_8_21_14_0_10_45_29]